jgi:PQQ-like domain
MKFHPVARLSLGRFPRCSRLLSLGLVLFFAAHAVAWNQFQGNAGHTGYAPASGVPQLETPTWTHKSIRFLDPTPATRFTPGIASDGENVFLSWHGWPSAVNGVSALNIATGVEDWEWTFTGNDAEDISAPAYENGRLYMHRWGHSSSCGIGCHDRPRLLGINAHNGQQLFDQTHSGQWSSGGRPTADGGQVYVAGGYYGGLDNYDGVTGHIEWFANMPQEYGWIPAVGKNKVYTSFNGNLTVVDKATGSQQTYLAGSVRRWLQRELAYRRGAP